jgi:hypothetical protein
MTGRGPYEYRPSRPLGRLGCTNSEAFFEGESPGSLVIRQSVFGIRLPDGELPDMREKRCGVSGVFGCYPTGAELTGGANRTP